MFTESVTELCVEHDLLYQCLNSSPVMQNMKNATPYRTSTDSRFMAVLAINDNFLVFLLCATMFLLARVSEECWRISAGGEMFGENEWWCVSGPSLIQMFHSFCGGGNKKRDLRYKIDAQMGGMHSQCESHSWGIMQQNKQYFCSSYVMPYLLTVVSAFVVLFINQDIVFVRVLLY